MSYSRSRSLSLVEPEAGAGPVACLRFIFRRTFVRATWPCASTKAFTQLRTHQLGVHVAAGMRHSYLIGCVLRLTLRLPNCFGVIESFITLLTYHSGLPSSSDRPIKPTAPSAVP